MSPGVSAYIARARTHLIADLLLIQSIKSHSANHRVTKILIAPRVFRLRASDTCASRPRLYALSYVGRRFYRRSVVEPRRIGRIDSGRKYDIVLSSRRTK